MLPVLNLYNCVVSRGTFPGTQEVAVKRKELTSQSGGVDRVCGMFPPDVVVEHLAIGRSMDMWLLQVHSIALNGTCNTANEDHGPIRLHVLNDADMGQGIIGLSVTIEIPGVIKKHKVAWSDIRSAMEEAMSMDMVVDEPDTVGVHIPAGCSVEIDAVFKVDGTGNSGTIVGNSFAMTRDRPYSDQPCCGPNDG